jgi:hypothetical protein
MINGDKNTGYDGFLRAGTLSLKLKSSLLELLDFAFLLGLTHRLVLFLGGRLSDGARAFTLTHLLLNVCLDLRGILHDQAMNSPKGRSANEIDVKFESTVVANLDCVNKRANGLSGGTYVNRRLIRLDHLQNSSRHIVWKRHKTS